MKERPILFSGPMVRALLSGQKTQTRRVVKPTPRWAEEFPICKPEGMAPDHEIWWWDGEHDCVGVSQSCPYGQVGDRLWVKETWRPTPTFEPWDLDVTYRADGHTRTIKDGEFGERDWTMPKAAATGNVSPLFMPRWASRLTLLITDIRVERLQDISDADAIAEGIHRIWPEGHISDDGPNHYTINVGGFNANAPTAVDVYRMLWEWINGPESWTANPWIWAITFEVVK